MASKALCEALQRREAFSDEKSGTINDVYPVVYFYNFLPTELYDKLKVELGEIDTFRKKHSDLFRFSQTGDLVSHSSNTLDKVKELLLNDFVKDVESIISRPLSRTQIDLSSQRYEKDEYLLTHDDRLDSRRVAFVLYLVDEDYDRADGGALEFFSTDWRGEPTMSVPSQKFYPKPNTLVLFEVSKSSHHQVQQMFSNKRRLSLAGWFHDPTKIPPNSKQIDKPAFITRDLTLSEEFIVELKTYAAFRRPEAKRITTTSGSFLSFQERGEPRWMKNLMSSSFTNYLAKEMDLTLDYPTRPVLKIYEQKDHYNNTLKMTENQQSLYVRIIVGQHCRLLAELKPMAITLDDTPCTVVEIQYAIIPSKSTIAKL
jgi:Rps23 Pro-64 3,4-dihydroxylase Tpa1-like proline 4-hydroxylase